MKNKTHILVISLLFLVSCNSSPSVSNESVIGNTDEFTFNIHTEDQKAFLESEEYTLPSGVDGKSENSKPRPVTLKVWDNAFTYINDISEYRVYVSKDEYFNESIVLVDKALSKTFKVYNLEINTRYYYTFGCATSTGEEHILETSKSFFIEGQAPRNLYIDGVTNFRDLGGWVIGEDEGYVPQNLLYRSAALSSNSGNNITEYGIKEFKKLGIKTEIDFRDPLSDNLTVTESPVEGVNYVNCGVNYHESYFTYEQNIEAFKNCFKVLADKTNYPVVFHCAIGTDRTGFVAFALNALAGVNYSDLIRDYVFSSFGNINGPREASTITSYIEQMKKWYKRAKIKDDIALYLEDIGLTSDEVNSLRDIVTGKVEF